MQNLKTKMTAFITAIVVFTLSFPTYIIQTIYVNAASDATSGQCGDNAFWEIEDDTLGITGTGDMWNYDIYSGSYAPWVNLNFTSAEIDDSITGIGDGAFSYCQNLESVIIPGRMTALGSVVFYQCENLVIYCYHGSPAEEYARFFSIKYVYIETPVSGQCGDEAYWEYKDNTVYITGKGYMWDYRFSYEQPWNGLAFTSLEIKDGIEKIGNKTFENCETLMSVKFGNHVGNIGISAFSGCTSLSAISIPDSVIYIEDSAFEDCVQLESVNISNNVSYLGWHAFSNWSSLTSFIIPENVNDISYMVFYGCKSLSSIVIPNTVTHIDVSAFSDCSNFLTIHCSSGSYAESFAIENGILYISSGEKLSGQCGDNAFWEYKDDTLYITGKGDMWEFIYHYDDYYYEQPWERVYFSNLIIEDGITHIGKSSFEDCVKLKSVVIPDSVITIGEMAFFGCKNLSSVIIPKNVKIINDYTFRSCDKLTSVVLSGNVQAISYNAFAFCWSLELIVIPESVLSIDPRAFIGSDNLTILCTPGSYAEQYSADSGINYKYIYTITFNTNGGSYIKPQTIIDGDTALNPNDPVKVYCDFMGWYADEYCTIEWNFDTPITEVTTIYAKWTEAEKYMLGDINGNGVVDAADAALALNIYALIQTGKQVNYSEKALIAADVNQNKVIDAADAAGILSYYAYVQTGGKKSSDEFFNHS